MPSMMLTVLLLGAGLSPSPTTRTRTCAERAMTRAIIAIIAIALTATFALLIVACGGGSCRSDADCSMLTHCDGQGGNSTGRCVFGAGMYLVLGDAADAQEATQ